MKESQNWYIRRGKAVKGPFPAGLISRYILLGRILESDEISHDRQEWVRVAERPDLVPEVVRQIREHPEDEEARRHLEAARRWADERREIKHPPEEGGERRSQEPVAEVLLREAHESHSELGAGKPAVSRRDYLALMVLLLLVVAVPFLLPSRSGPDEPQCEAPAAPQVNWSNCRMAGAQWPNADLAGATLRNADLGAALLRAVNLSSADLAYANLTLANLRGANLRGAVLKGATLRRADLINANLTGADLSYADLAGAQWEGAVLEGARLDHAIWADGVVCLPGSVGSCRPGRVTP